MINYALSPLIENLTLMTSSKWKINVICIVENCLSYNISKFGRKLITDKRDNYDYYDNYVHVTMIIWSQSICIQNLGSFGPTQRLLRYKTKWDLTFDLHLHNQDGLISMPSYYAIWLSRHTPYMLCILNLGSIGPTVPEIQNKMRFDLWPSYFHEWDNKIISAEKHPIKCRPTCRGQWIAMISAPEIILKNIGVWPMGVGVEPPRIVNL